MSEDDVEESKSKFVTILDLAKFRGVKEDADGSINMGSFDDVRLPMMGGCQYCMASCAAYNMCPTKTGNCSCLECVHDGNGFETVEEANRFCFPDEYEWQGVKTIKPVSHDLNYDSQDYSDNPSACDYSPIYDFDE